MVVFMRIAAISTMTAVTNPPTKIIISVCVCVVFSFFALGPFGARSIWRNYVHSATVSGPFGENTSIQRDSGPFSAEWTDLAEKVVCRMDRNLPTKLRPFGGSYVHSANTATTLEPNA